MGKKIVKKRKTKSEKISESNKRGKKKQKSESSYLARKKIIYFVSGNKNKLREITHMFNENLKDVEIRQLDIDLPEFQGLPEDIIKSKIKLAFEKVKKPKGPFLVEDSSLCFNAYGGLPGAYIKYFLKAIKPEGLFKMASVFEDHSAYALSIFALQKNKKEEPHLFIGRAEGEIVPPRGDNNFEWDTCFRPKNYKMTFAEMSEEEKNKISHRGKSTKALINWIKNNPEIF